MAIQSLYFEVAVAPSRSSLLSVLFAVLWHLVLSTDFQVSIGLSLLVNTPNWKNYRNDRRKLRSKTSRRRLLCRKPLTNGFSSNLLFVHDGG